MKAILKQFAFHVCNNLNFSFCNFLHPGEKKPQCELDNVPLGRKNEKNCDIETTNSFWSLKLRRILQNLYFTI